MLSLRTEVACIWSISSAVGGSFLHGGGAALPTQLQVGGPSQVPTPALCSNVQWPPLLHGPTQDWKLGPPMLPQQKVLTPHACRTVACIPGTFRVHVCHPQRRLP